MNCGTQLQICTLLRVGMQYNQYSKRKERRDSNTKKVRSTARLPTMRPSFPLLYYYIQLLPRDHLNISGLTYLHYAEMDSLNNRTPQLQNSP